MAETQSKRQREETQVVAVAQQVHAHEHDEEMVETKRRKSSPTSPSSYNEILSLLDEEEDMPSNQDVSSLITTLQEEISSDSNNNVELDIDDLDFDPLTCKSTGGEGGGEDCSSVSSSSSSQEDGEEGERERVMRHLLEASDDELGLPSVENGGEDRVFNGGEVLNFGDNLWELEDETATYYTLLQSELFSCE